MLIASLLQSIIELQHPSTATVGEVTGHVAAVGTVLAAAVPTCWAAAGAVRRVLHLLREEAGKRVVNSGTAVQQQEPELNVVDAIAAAVASESASASSSSSTQQQHGWPSSVAVQPGQSLTSIRLPPAVAALKWSKSISQAVLDGVQELIDECDNIDASLSPAIADHIRPGEAVMVQGSR